MFPNRLDAFSNDILAVWCVHNIKVGGLSVPHAKTRVMLGVNEDIFHPCKLGQNYQLFRVESFWIKRLGQLIDKSFQIIIRSPYH